MIQRIQTLYLFLAFIGFGLSFFFPFATFISDLAYYKFTLTGFHHIHPDPSPVFTWVFAFPLWLLDTVAGVFVLYILFQYKDRIRQLKLLRISVLISIILVALIFYYSASLIEKKLGMTAHYGIGIYFPLASLLFQILATRGIRSDEAKVRSANRLR